VSARSNTPAKGGDYEQLRLASLGAVAVRAGDCGASRVGADRGFDGVLVGDLLVRFTSLGDVGTCLVVECKNQAKSRNIDAWRTELAAARSNRHATVSIGLCPQDSMPVPGQRLIVLDDKSLIVSHDPDVDGADDPVLAAAYLLARLVSTPSQLEDRDDVDLTDAHRQLDDLRTALEPIEKLELEAAKIDKASAVIQALAASLRNDLIARIDRVQSTLNP
jgi:hypothetical protein